MPDESKPRRVPLGEPLTADELEQLEGVRGPADLDQAKERWRTDAPSGFKDLIDAPRTPDG